jgi:hypothetical protein
MSNHALNRDDGAYICHTNKSILLAGDVTPWVYKKPRCDLDWNIERKTLDWSIEKNTKRLKYRKSLMKTLHWSAETLGRECNSTVLCIHLLKPE